MRRAWRAACTGVDVVRVCVLAALAIVGGCTNVTVVHYPAPEYTDAPTEAGLQTCETTGRTRAECCEAHGIEPCRNPQPVARRSHR